MSNEVKKSVMIGTQPKNDEGISTVVEDKEFSPEESANQLMAKEEDFLQGLVKAANYKDDEEQSAKIEIIRPDGNTGKKKLLFEFHVTGLSEREYIKCKNKWTKYVRNKNLGITMPEKTDNARYRAAIIYEATIPKDREKLWDNKKVWQALRAQDKQIVTGLDVIEECLKAGEKDSVIDVIDRLSGYDDNIEEVAGDLSDTIKN